MGGGRGAAPGRGARGGGRGGRGGPSYVGSGGRGGGNQNAMRGHGPRSGFGNRDHHNRRGGSFSASGGGYSQPSSFRGRHHGHQSSGRSGRQDSGSALGVRDGPMNSSFGSTGKKDENRRTFTDFKLIGLEILDLNWSWGIQPLSEPSLKTGSDGAAEISDATQMTVQPEPVETEALSKDSSGAECATVSSVSENTGNEVVSARGLKAVPTEAVILPPTQETSSGTLSSPPSRVRIYFHTPVSLDDSHPMSHTFSFSAGIGTVPSDSRKGKRKKSEDDDGDLEEGRTRPPPPQMSDEQSSATPSGDVEGTGRASADPSVAESASEGDWLMNAIAEDDAGGDTDNQFDAEGDDDVLHVSEVLDAHEEESSSPESDGHEADGEWFHVTSKAS
jgi:20S proteasome subunit alpha 6